MGDKLGTKEKIILAAIDLFSQKGYYETTVREIAGSVGIHVSSLYSHFEGKEIILDVILNEYQDELNKAKPSEEVLDRIVEFMSPEVILISGFKIIRKSVSSDKMNKIISILLIEMYRNPKVREFYKKWYFDVNRYSYYQLFQKMMQKGRIRACDPEVLSNLYNGMVSSFYQEYFLLKADQESTDFLENKFEKQMVLFLDFISKKEAPHV